MVADVLVIVPSPRSQTRFVITPSELSVKVIVRGLEPEEGLATKAAIGYGGTTETAKLAVLLAGLGSAV